MPTPLLKKFADKYNVPIEKMEKLWKIAKAAATKYRDPSDVDYYAVTVGLLKKMAAKAKKESLNALLDSPSISESVNKDIYYCSSCGSMWESSTPPGVCRECDSKRIRAVS